MTREELEQMAHDLIARSIRMSGTWTVADHAHAKQKLTAEFAAIWNAAVEECKRKCLMERTAEATTLPITGAFNRGLEKASEVCAALKVPT